MKKILLHSCCGPCTTYVNQWLRENDFQVTSLFYNPNIRPEEEYQKRLAAMQQYAAAVGLKVIYSTPKETETFSRACRQAGLRFPIEIGDCQKCYEVRLTKTAEIAKELGISSFTSTLLVSPYQKHETLKKIAKSFIFITAHGWKPKILFLWRGRGREIFLREVLIRRFLFLAREEYYAIRQ